MVMDASSFERLASATLQGLMEAIETALGDAVTDSELSQGILRLELADGGVYLLNKHAANREIWLSSPRSGASHFRFEQGRWRSTRDATDLHDLLAAELSQAASSPVTLHP